MRKEAFFSFFIKKIYLFLTQGIPANHFQNRTR